jgi:histidinol dehydrogenase
LESDRYSEKIRNAGSVFLGAYSTESVGDYASGPNHVLPTKGYARTFGGLSMDSFLKKISFQKLSKEGLEKISETVKTMSVSEVLNAHAFSVQSRIRNKNND